MNIQIRETNGYIKPKNFSRKVFICSCQCTVLSRDLTYSTAVVYENVMVKYEVEPNKDLNYEELLNRKYWSQKISWGKFKKVVELPLIFSKLNEEDFIVYIGHFTRDKVLMPFISKIEILNIEKYNILKIKEQRKDKLKKIKNS
jgi:hypothetical protein